MPNAKDSRLSPSEALEALARAAVDVAKKARRHHKSLEGDNFYANKLATIRADATNSFRSLNSGGPGDSSAVAELMETIFAPLTQPKLRAKALQEFSYNLRTAWRSTPVPREDEGLFPLSILSKTRRGYLVTIGRQMNGCFTSGWHDAAAVMMRRIVEVSIIEAFEGKGIANKIKDGNGNYFQLTDLIRMALAESAWTLSRNTRGSLPNLRDAGHMSAHGRYFTASPEDIEKLRPSCRIIVEEFLHHAGLL